MLGRLTLLSASLLIVAVMTGPVWSQLDVYDNQAGYGFTAIGFGSPVTMWDDLQLTQGGLLSEISFVADPPASLGQTASGVIDLRVFDETFNRPQGDPLGTIPFSGTFELDPTDPFNQRLVIELTGLESLGINLPTVGRIGAGIRFDDNGWFFPDAGTPELGTSPGGNWLDNSSLERSDVDGLGWRVAVVDPAPVGPGVGSYNLFETSLATPNDPSGSSGSLANDAFFRGVGFRVERTTHLKQVGGWIGGTGTIFAAIVDLGENQFAVPDPFDLSGSDVLATTLIDLDGTHFNGEDVVADLELALEPGAYMLVFGADKFGADPDAEGYFRANHIPNGDWTLRGIRQSDGLHFSSAGNYRLFAVADSAPGTLQVRPSFDVLAEVTRDEVTDDVEDVRLIDGDPTITVDVPASASDPDQVAVFEFSLGELPANRHLLAVTLELDLYFANTLPPTQFDVFGYAGDGAAGRQDAVGQQTVVGETDIDSTGIVSIQIDPAFVASLAGSASHLGLTIVPDDTGAFGFGTLEGGELREPPLLTFSLGGPLLPGDFDFNNEVNGEDFLVWQRGESTTPYSESDLSDWEMNYGTIWELATAANVVPEPTIAVVLSSTVLGLGGVRKKRGPVAA